MGEHHLPHGWTDRTLARTYDARPVVSQFDTIEACAEAFDTEVRTVHRWLESGISVGLADKIALRLGVHPNDVWPTWFEDALYDTDGLRDKRERRNRREVDGQMEMTL